MRYLLLLISSFFIACSPIYYSPATQNVPLFSDKKQLNVGVYTQDENFVELQSAYSPGKHIGIMLNAFYAHPDDNNEGDGGSAELLEGGVGYFYELQPKLIIEIYGLYGAGKMENHFQSQNDGRIKANFETLSIQPAIGYHTKYFDACLSFRLSQLSYNNISGNLIFGREDQVQYLNARRDQLLIEKALTIRAGLEFIKLQLQIGSSDNMTYSNFYQNEGYLSLGLVANLNIR